MNLNVSKWIHKDKDKGDYEYDDIIIKLLMQFLKNENHRKISPI